jgi:hypothetical protein
MKLKQVSRVLEEIDNRADHLKLLLEKMSLHYEKQADVLDRESGKYN